MMASNSAVHAEGVWKKFKIYHERNQTLKDVLLRMGRAKYEEFWALKDFDIDIPQGQTLGILGRNGSGKSTLLKVVAGILQPNKGTIEVTGRLASLLELGAGFEPDLSGRENVFLNGSILGLTTKETTARFDEIVGFAELEKFIDMPVKSYSSGMYIRLGFSIAVHTDPEILLFDEVLAVGDESFQQKCIDRIESMKRDGKTMLFVTHDPDVMERICDTAIMLEAGQIASQGRPTDVARAYHKAMITVRKGEEGGSRVVDITSAEILDGENKEVDFYRPGGSMTIRLAFEAHETIPEPVFGFGIYDQRGNKCFGTNTQLRGIHLDPLSGKGKFEFRLTDLPLIEGLYSISLALHSPDSKEIYHWQERFYTFYIKRKYDDEGYLYMPLKLGLEGKTSEDGEKR